MRIWDDNEPIYRQLRNLVLSQLMAGRYAEGEALPSVRQVAGEERINPLTVSRAYQLLVDEGLLEKRRGLGMFVSAGAREKALEQERKRFLANEWPTVLLRARTLGLCVDDLPRAIEDV
jgi:GntR family transcriptional regulator